MAPSVTRAPHLRMLEEDPVTGLARARKDSPPTGTRQTSAREEDA
ncbi:MAG: hypothetical protein JWR28_2477 [Modestobacter sp.]|jgi:hypothetical protein|nr:hypothetical protein [Modestobacter sp.]